MYGLDLLDFFRGRYSWRKLSVLLAGLSKHSRYATALAQDEDYARRVLDRTPATPAKVDASPSLTEYTPEVEMLTVVAEQQGVIISRLEQIAGYKRPHKPRRLPRPHTAFDRVRRQKAEAGYNSLVDEVTQAQARWSQAKESDG